MRSPSSDESSWGGRLKSAVPIVQHLGSQLVMGTTRDIAFQLPINPPRMIHQLVAVFAKLCYQPKAASS